jgi:hypothetical protein
MNFQELNERIISATRSTVMVNVDGIMKPRKKVVKVLSTESVINESPDNAWRNRMDRQGATHYHNQKDEYGSSDRFIHAFKKEDGEKKYLGSFDKIKQKETNMKVKLDEAAWETPAETAEIKKHTDNFTAAQKAGDASGMAKHRALVAGAQEKSRARAAGQVSPGEAKYGPASGYGKGKYMGDSTVLSFSEYKQIHESVVTSIDEHIAAAKAQLGENSPFDWKNHKSTIDWSGKKKSPETSKEGGTIYKARETTRDSESGGAAPKKEVGRPAGEYGNYKIDKASRDSKEYKDALSKKVRDAKADGFAARDDFKKLMDTAIKKRQLELANK